MRNQFWYKRITYLPPAEEGGEKVQKEWNDSFHLDKVIRSMAFEKETVVLLDDGHETSEDLPFKNKKGGVEYKRQRIWSQSEIHLTDPDDIARFRNVSDVNGWVGEAKIAYPKVETSENSKSVFDSTSNVSTSV